jgi:hypothetical protein
LWTTGIKKGLAALVMQLDSRVTEAPARRADRRRHHNLQDMRIGRYNSIAPRGYLLTGIVGRGCDLTGVTRQGALYAAEDIICYS